MQFSTDLHPVAVLFFNGLKRCQRLVQFGRADELTLCSLSCKIKWPYLHRVNAHVEKTSCQSDRIIKESVQVFVILVGSQRRNTKVLGSTQLCSTYILVTGTRVVNRDLATYTPPQQNRYRLTGYLAQCVP